MTDGDRFIEEQLQTVLRPGETISHTAYLTTASGTGVMGGLRKKAYWAALTPMRLILIETRVGAFKPLLENKGIQSIERTEIAGVHVDRTLRIAVAGGTGFSFEANRKPKHASGQAGFIDELAECYAGGRATEQLASKGKWWKVAGTVAVAALGIGGFAYQQFYSGRAEVHVECQQLLTGVRCTAEHRSGGADAKACWDVRFTCNNGKQTVGHACTVVADGATNEVVIPHAEFRGIEGCDGVKASRVVNLEVTKP